MLEHSPTSMATVGHKQLRKLSISVMKLYGQDNVNSHTYMLCKTRIYKYIFPFRQISLWAGVLPGLRLGMV